MTYCKKIGRDRLVFDPDVLEQLESEVVKRKESIDRRRELLAMCLEKLPSPQRQLLEMRYSASATIESIASQLNRPEVRSSKRYIAYENPCWPVSNKGRSRGDRRMNDTRMNIDG